MTNSLLRKRGESGSVFFITVILTIASVQCKYYVYSVSVVVGQLLYMIIIVVPIVHTS